MFTRYLCLITIVMLVFLLNACGNSTEVLEDIVVPDTAASVPSAEWCWDYKTAYRNILSGAFFTAQCYEISSSSEAFKTSMTSVMQDAGYRLEGTESDVADGITITAEGWRNSSFDVDKVLVYFADKFVLIGF